jgi:hypothetical protein
MEDKKVSVTYHVARNWYIVIVVSVLYVVLYLASLNLLTISGFGGNTALLVMSAFGFTTYTVITIVMTDSPHFDTIGKVNKAFWLWAIVFIVVCLWHALIIMFTWAMSFSRWAENASVVLAFVPIGALAIYGLGRAMVVTKRYKKMTSS